MVESHRRIDVFAVLLAVFILGLGAYLSTFPTDIVRWIGLALMAGAVIGLSIWFCWERVTAVTGSSHKWVRAKIKPTIGIGILCAAFGGIFIASHWPLSSPPQRVQPPETTPLATREALYSRSDKLIFACGFLPTQSPPTPEKLAEIKKQVLTTYKIWGGVIGYTITLSDIDAGFRIAVEATTQDAKDRLRLMGIWPLVTTVNFDVRLIGGQIVVVVLSGGLPPQMHALLLMFPPDPLSLQVRQLANQIEKMLGLDPGVCRLI